MVDATTKIVNISTQNNENQFHNKGKKTHNVVIIHIVKTLQCISQTPSSL